jgi:hypothetical protein
MPLGVFPKTLRNMWFAVAFFNPIISFLSLCVMPLADIQKHNLTLLAAMAQQSSGTWLAFVVLFNKSCSSPL